MKQTKFNLPIMFGILFLLGVVMMLIMVLPNMFGTIDTISESNNVSTSEYATEYEAGQTLVKYGIIFLEAAAFALGILFLIMIVKAFL